jgi:hypothetical protein
MYHHYLGDPLEVLLLCAPHRSALHAVRPRPLVSCAREASCSGSDRAPIVRASRSRASQRFRCNTDRHNARRAPASGRLTPRSPSRAKPAPSRVVSRRPHGSVVEALSLQRVQLSLAALTLAACGGGAEEVRGISTLPRAACGPAEYGGEGDPQALLASDLPMQGAARGRSEQMVEAIRLELERRDWRAGSVRVALQPCDDSLVAHRRMGRGQV